MTGDYLGDLFNTAFPEGLTWDEVKGKLIASGRSGIDNDIFELGLTGTSSTLYNPADIGRALGIVVIDGQTYWSDWDNGEVYKLKGTDDIATSVSGLNTPGHLLQVDPIPAGERSWTRTTSGNWSDWDNWTYWSRPDTSDEVAVFGSALGAVGIVDVNDDYTVKGLRFRNANKYVIGGGGSLTLEAYTGRALMSAQWVKIPRLQAKPSGSWFWIGSLSYDVAGEVVDQANRSAYWGWCGQHPAAPAESEGLQAVALGLYEPTAFRRW